MQAPRVGDLVKTDDGLSGRLVVDIEAAEAVDGFDAAEWANLEVGVVVKTDEIGLVHYASRTGITILDG
jgi:hypothetical protein